MKNASSGKYKNQNCDMIMQFQVQFVFKVLTHIIQKLNN